MPEVETDAMQPSLFTPEAQIAPAAPLVSIPALNAQSALAAAITAFYPDVVRQGFQPVDLA